MVAALLAMSPVRSMEYWWHLSIGRLVDYWGRVPATNFFSYTGDPETSLFIQPWASQWFLFVLHDLGGIDLPIFIRSVLAAATLFAVTWIAARKTGSSPRAATAALMAVPVLVFA
ncbi:MAG: hypothetical protein ACNA8W_00855, partial [Bradymonadaceae bacterium]